jgi:hypothetical protein
MSDGQKSPLMYLSDFLDTKGVTEAERTFYMKHFSAPNFLSQELYQKTSQEWTKLTKIK